MEVRKVDIIVDGTRVYGYTAVGPDGVTTSVLGDDPDWRETKVEWGRFLIDLGKLVQIEGEAAMTERAMHHEGDRDGAERLAAWCGGRVCEGPEGWLVEVESPEGVFDCAAPGDWIVKREDGSLAVLRQRERT